MGIGKIVRISNKNTNSCHKVVVTISDKECIRGKYAFKKRTLKKHKTKHIKISRIDGMGMGVDSQIIA